MNKNEKLVEKLNRPDRPALWSFAAGLESQDKQAGLSLLQQSRRALNPSFWWAVWYILPKIIVHFLNIWQPKHGNPSAVKKLNWGIRNL